MPVKADELEDVYQLSPLQHGMLYHNLYAPSEGNYIEQSLLNLTGRMDTAAFWAAWDTVVARHGALRTTFHWDEISKPVQAVRRQGALEHDERDLSHLAPCDQDEVIHARFLEERRGGFDLEAAPPMRVTLYRLGGDRYKVALRFHHLILDGWSVGIVLSEFMTLYKAGVAGRPANLPLPGRYRDYVAWWMRQRPDDAEAFWRERLTGYRPPAPVHLGGVESLDGEVSHERENLSLAEVADEVRAFAREHRLTANTLIQSAWALVLAACTAADDVVVGITFAHRPQEMAHADATVGCMVSTVPVRTVIRPGLQVVEWLREVQDLVIAVREHSAVSLVDIHSWSGVPRSEELFESLVAFQNVPLPEFSLAKVGLELEGYVFDSRPHVPFSLAVLPGGDFPLRLVYDRRRLDADGARLLLGAVRAALLAIVRGPEEPLDALTDPVRLGLPVGGAMAAPRTTEAGTEPGVPRNETEAAVAELMAELLETGPLGVHDNLVEAGLHSLLGTQVVNRVMDRWKTPVSLRALFEEPTVAGLARLIEGGGAEDAGSQVRGRLDLVAETALGDDIRPGGEPGWVPDPERILLVGATGYAGTALLSRLLHDTEATVTCLVRCESEEEGRARVQQALRAAGLWREEQAGRMEIVPGNLARPALGLDEGRFAELGTSIDEIHHVGGVVNIMSSYRRVMRTNVEGAREVLRLATTGRTVPVHYLSAAALTHHPDPARAGLELPLDPDVPAAGSGYLQAKWVADRMMTLAQEREVPVVLYRASRLIGSPGEEHWKLGDGTSEILRVCARLNAFPDCDVAMTASPVGHVTAAMSALARDKDSLGQVFHLVSPRPFTFLDVGEAMRACGYDVRSMELEAWYAELVRLSLREPSGNWDTAMAVLGPWVRGVLGGMREPAYSCERAARALGDRPGFPPIDPDFLAGCIKHFQRAGHIAAP
ncbi:thioester reductase domain-containing protein [Nonomuraea sp. NPDC050786]|uniref:thioester reductase domain-containing protein n=1 Tax=Nonomuraea sp. NPDC050786 TaxID=3154840 RepID=UPI003407A7A8